MHSMKDNKHIWKTTMTWKISSQGIKQYNDVLKTTLIMETGDSWMKYNELFIAKKISHHKVIGKKRRHLTTRKPKASPVPSTRFIFIYLASQTHYLYLYICIKNPGNNDNLCV